MRDMSTLKLLGLPSEFGVTLLILCFILAVAPFFPDADFGVLRIPAFTPKLLKRLRIIGPLGLVLVVLLHLPFWSKRGHKQVGPPAEATPQASSTVPRSKPTEVKQSTGIAGKPEAKEPRPSFDASPVGNFYKIHLLLPTSMKTSGVLVNGVEAPIIRRTANVITIEAPSGLDSYTIDVIGADGQTCDITVVLAEDSTTLTPCQT